MKVGFFYAACMASFLVCLWLNAEIVGIYVLAVLAGAALLLSKKPIYALCPLAMVCLLTLTRRYDYTYYFNALPAAVFLLFSASVRLVKNAKKPKLSIQYISAVIVSIAVSIGGITVAETEEIVNSLYFIVSLGVGMVFVLLYCFLTMREDRIELNFSVCMTVVGMACVGFLAVAFAKNLGGYNGETRYLTDRFFWNNDLSTMLLLTMPFAFFLASRAPHPSLYYLCGLLQGLALIFSLSRGGMLFGTLVLLPSAVLAIVFAKGKREQLAVTLVLFLLIAFIFWQGFLRGIVSSLILKFDFKNGNGRIELYHSAWKIFSEHPLFGRGLGYVPDVGNKPKYGIFWYHSTFFQVAASLGIVGLVAYGVQLAVRIYLLIKGKSAFNLFVALAMLGFGGYSMINVGTFVPFPFVAMVTVIFAVVELVNGRGRNTKNNKASPTRPL